MRAIPPTMRNAISLCVDPASGLAPEGVFLAASGRAGRVFFAGLMILQGEDAQGGQRQNHEDDDEKIPRREIAAPA